MTNFTAEKCYIWKINENMPGCGPYIRREDTNGVWKSVHKYIEYTLLV